MPLPPQKRNLAHFFKLQDIFREPRSQAPMKNFKIFPFHFLWIRQKVHSCQNKSKQECLQSKECRPYYSGSTSYSRYLSGLSLINKNITSYLWKSSNMCALCPYDCPLMRQNSPPSHKFSEHGFRPAWLMPKWGSLVSHLILFLSVIENNTVHITVSHSTP